MKANVFVNCPDKIALKNHFGVYPEVTYNNLRSLRFILSEVDYEIKYPDSRRESHVIACYCEDSKQ